MDLFGIIDFVVRTFIIVCLVDGLIMGIPLPAKKGTYKKEYMLKRSNRFDYQKNMECSGFSAAFVLRSYGMKADGNDFYANIPFKMPGGAVAPIVLKREIIKRGLKAKYVKGSIETLKADLSDDKRIIVFIRTKLGKRWLHYVPIVGYDENHIYIAESMKSLVNCEDAHSNRKLSSVEFLKFWDTREIYMPFYRNTYLVIEGSESVSQVEGLIPFLHKESPGVAGAM